MAVCVSDVSLGGGRLHAVNCCGGAAASAPHLVCPPLPMWGRACRRPPLPRVTMGVAFPAPLSVTTWHPSASSLYPLAFLLVPWEHCPPSLRTGHGASARHLPRLCRYPHWSLSLATLRAVHSRSCPCRLSCFSPSPPHFSPKVTCPPPRPPAFLVNPRRSTCEGTWGSEPPRPSESVSPAPAGPRRAPASLSCLSVCPLVRLPSPRAASADGLVLACDCARGALCGFLLSEIVNVEFSTVGYRVLFGGVPELRPCACM